MNVTDFNKLFENFEKTFGRYSDLVKGRIFHYCRDLTKDQFHEVCIRFVDQDKKPGVNDFRLKARALLMARHEIPQDIARLPCERCHDVGVLKLRHKKEKFRSMCLCDCDEGKRQTWKLPVFDETQMAEFEIEDFKKHGKQGETYWDAAKVWSEQIKMAQQFWEGQGVSKK